MGLLTALGITVNVKDTVLFQIHINGKHDPERSTQVLTILRELSLIRLVRSRLKNGHSAFQDYADGFEIGVQLARGDAAHAVWRKAFQTSQMATLETRIAVCSPTGNEYSLLYRLVTVNVDSEKIPPSYRQAFSSLKDRVGIFLENTSKSFDFRDKFRTVLEQGADQRELPALADDVLYWMRQAASSCDEAMKSIADVEAAIVEELAKIFPDSVVLIKDL